MSDAKRLCLNMIVKNEMANLERCLNSVAKHVSCWVIGDTGSTDGTQEFVKRFFAERQIPGELHSFPFHNFEQARNAALDHAYASPLGYDYLLFDDADMELVVEDADFRSKLTGPGYRLRQSTSGGLSYSNTRIVRRDAGARYHGVTHEYIDVPGGVEELSGVSYIDHASGSNRVDKFERDIRLLKAALENDPKNARYWFYLAQSLRDAGRGAEAADAYARRAGMGGWDEEAWMARLQQARCLRALGDEGGFVSKALQAFNQRPQRAEPLYDLARYYREKGDNHTAALFAEFGITIGRPADDILFIEDFVYSTALLEEYSIAANYAGDAARKDRGFDACNYLALKRGIASGPRQLAWSNLYFYIQPADTMLPSFTSRPMDFAPPDDYLPLNPSITRLGDEIFVAQRAVNYVLSEDGHHYRTPEGQEITTRNFLLHLNDDLSTRSMAEILPPRDLPEPAFPLVRGFEDLRLFGWRGALWGSACVRELTPEGWCEQVLARLEHDGHGAYRLVDWQTLDADGAKAHEKNWMPQVDGDALRFLYLCDPTRVVNSDGHTIQEQIPAISGDRFRGGSQLVAFDGGWLALIHEVQQRDGEARRCYFHRFVWFDDGNRLAAVSRPFFFKRKGVEFAAGLAWHPDQKRLLVSFSVADSESWVATVEADDIRPVLEPTDKLRDGRTEQPLPAFIGTALQMRSAAKSSGAGNPAHPTVKATMPSDALSRATGDKAELSPTIAFFEAFAPFLCFADAVERRRDATRAFDQRIAPLLGDSSTSLPTIQLFYEAMSDQHQILIAATSSMRAAGHAVRVWTYSPEKLAFLAARGIELRNAADVVPKALFERVVARSEVRFFSDIFRYAVLYEHGGLWMDSDVILLKPFPFIGDYFFNLQWRGGHRGHFICGNVIFAKPFSHHIRTLYERSIDCLYGPDAITFGDVGPKLLSDYIASAEGYALRAGVFSPILFNAIDWTELDKFNRPAAELADYLNDDRVFGIHLWTARNQGNAESSHSLIALLTQSENGPASFTDLADRFNTDKNRHTGNRHCYARVYDRLLSDRRLSLSRLMEIGLCRGLAERNQTETPSVALWQSYFPFCHVTGVDLTDFSTLNDAKFTSYVCDQSKRDQLRALTAKLEPGSFDVIIDDGSHASLDEQQTLIELFPLLVDGGWYFIEDLDWQPPGEDPSKITLTKTLLKEIARDGKTISLDPFGVSAIANQMDEILFFDSHYELTRAKLMGGLVAIRKQSGTESMR